jgi:predicted GH43/DUF377 family glycosyl hydrolase
VDPVATAVFQPEGESETFGVEDPRITPIDGTYWFTYVAVSEHGAATALGSTSDFQSFQRHGIIFPTENKDVVLFPERLASQYLALHRPNGATPFTAPEMWLARSPDLIHWGAHCPLPVGSADWECSRVGAGTPPLRTPDGWLEIYHGNRKGNSAKAVGAYQAAAILLSADEPSRILGKSAEPILTPSADFEHGGFVPDVVFPTGIVQRDDVLSVYYGAADCCLAVVELSLGEVLAGLA